MVDGLGCPIRMVDALIEAEAQTYPAHLEKQEEIDYEEAYKALDEEFPGVRSF